jgi:hypothetical protein
MDSTVFPMLWHSRTNAGNEALRMVPSAARQGEGGPSSARFASFGGPAVQA